jgi:transcriptional regulator with XRE-family HTH domain
MNNINDDTNAPLDNAKWIEKAKWRKKNRKWLRYSNKIALRILAAIEEKPGMNQAKLADMLFVSPQQISKIVKGKENLTLDTIGKLSDALGFDLIAFPEFKYSSVQLSLSSTQTMGVTTLVQTSPELFWYNEIWPKSSWEKPVQINILPGIFSIISNVNRTPDTHGVDYSHYAKVI